MTRTRAQNRPPKQRGNAPKHEIVINPDPKNSKYQKDTKMDIAFHVLLLFLAAIGIASGWYFAASDPAAATGQFIIAATALLIGPFVGAATVILWTNRKHESKPTYGEAVLALLKSWLKGWQAVFGILFAVIVFVLFKGSAQDLAKAFILPWVLYAVAIVQAIFATPKR